MKALVTGAAGFLGRHFVTELVRRGWSVARCDIVYGWDALDLFTNHRVRYDLVVHCAASAPHRAAIDGEPVHLARNLLLDSAMFDWAVRTGQGRVLYLSSSAAYPARFQAANTPTVMTESMLRLDDVIQPDAGYGWTKVTGEMMAAAVRSTGVPVTVVRPFSGYGEDQGVNFPFGAFAARARRWENPFTVWGDGQQVRDWIHVDDVVAGALAVAEDGTPDPVNLCTGTGTSMVDLATAVCREAGYEPALEFRLDKPAGVSYRVGSPDRMQRFYIPQVSLEDGVKRAMADGRAA